ncbi:hypothetical protein GBAR_LOCUS13473, partial [Geodia barretti]
MDSLQQWLSILQWTRLSRSSSSSLRIILRPILLESPSGWRGSGLSKNQTSSSFSAPS